MPDMRSCSPFMDLDGAKASLSAIRSGYIGHNCDSLKDIAWTAAPAILIVPGSALLLFLANGGSSDCLRSMAVQSRRSDLYTFNIEVQNCSAQA